jgi:regulator of protease activity HflC (stomatin/prohibitin superfamily)
MRSNYFFARLTLFLVMLGAFGALSREYWSYAERADMGDAMQQLRADIDVAQLRDRMMLNHQVHAERYIIGWIVFGGASLALFSSELKIAISSLRTSKTSAMFVGMLAILMASGCVRPFQPIKLEVIQPNEEAFLLPFTENIEKQQSTNTEEYLRRNLVHSQQVKIPQQWVPTGYEYSAANGAWRDAAILVRVDKSPVTREWTADPNSGTSSKNEAIWVMTSDQVEFSTGWTCTARVATRDDAVKFLHNYPNGALQQVMDQEVRAKLQSEFGLEVTDLPMEELRTKASPHIKRVVETLVKGFSERGITITNLGISGGFIYKDPSIVKMHVEVFNAEQKKQIAVSEASTQIEKNKTIQLEAEAKSKAILEEQQGVAEGIKLIADARTYELEKIREHGDVYIRLQHLEIEKARNERWDGRYPTTMIGESPDSLHLFMDRSMSSLIPVVKQ